MFIIDLILLETTAVLSDRSRSTVLLFLNGAIYLQFVYRGTDALQLVCYVQQMVRVVNHSFVCFHYALDLFNTVAHFCDSLRYIPVFYQHSTHIFQVHSNR